MTAILFFGAFVISASVNRTTPAIETAWERLFLTTFEGSRTPACKDLRSFHVIALNPNVGLACSTFSSITELSKPLFDNDLPEGGFAGICRVFRADLLIAIEFDLSADRLARSRATPPPTTMPSSRAARVALRLSSKICFRFFISDSVGAPTLIKATPPESLALRSSSFSRSYLLSVFFSSVSICAMRVLDFACDAFAADDCRLIFRDRDLIGTAQDIGSG